MIGMLSWETLNLPEGPHVVLLPAQPLNAGEDSVVTYPVCRTVSTIPIGVSIGQPSDVFQGSIYHVETPRPIQSVKAGSKTFIAGATTDLIMIDPHFRVSRVGMPAPVVAPTLSAGSGSDEQYGYFRYYDELTDEYSSLGPASTLVTGNTTRTWSGFPTDDGQIHPPDQNGYEVGTNTLHLLPQTVLGPASTYYTDSSFEIRRLDWVKYDGEWYQANALQDDYVTHEFLGDTAFGAATDVIYLDEYRPRPRASHICLYVSINGGFPREVVKLRIGSTSSYTESVPTLSLGAAFLEAYEPMPQGNIIAYSNDRLFIAGGPDPTRVYMSELFYPERYGGLNFPTKNGEPVTGIFPLKEYVIITTANSVHVLTGYTENDMELDVAYYGSGCSGPLMGTVVDGVLYYAGEDGVFLYDGSPVQINKQRAQEWRETVEANRNGYVTQEPGKVLKWNVEQKSTTIVGILDGKGASVSVGGFRYLPSNAWVLDLKNGMEWVNDSYQDPPGTGILITKGSANYAAYSYGYNSTTFVPYVYRIGNFNPLLSAVDGWHEFSPFLILPPVGSEDLAGNFSESKKIVKVFAYCVSDSNTTNITIVTGDGFGPFSAENVGGLTDADPGTDFGMPTYPTYTDDGYEFSYGPQIVYRLVHPRKSGFTFTGIITGKPQSRWRFLGMTYLLAPGSGRGGAVSAEPVE